MPTETSIPQIGAIPLQAKCWTAFSLKMSTEWKHQCLIIFWLFIQINTSTPYLTGVCSEALHNLQEQVSVQFLLFKSHFDFPLTRTSKALFIIVQCRNLPTDYLSLSWKPINISRIRWHISVLLNFMSCVFVILKFLFVNICSGGSQAPSTSPWP